MKKGKKCNKCNVEKGLEEFSFRKDNNKYRSDCKECQGKQSRIRSKKWYQENKEKNYKRSREWIKNHPEERRKYDKKWYDNNIDKVLAKNARFREEHPEKYLEYRKRTYENMRKDPRRKLRKILSSKISTVISNRGDSKNGKSTFNEILPYTVNELIEHLESLFEPGMTWNNYGHGEGKWSIDHDIPDSWFEYEDMNDKGFQKSWALENLQPMWANENCKKRNKFVGKFNKKGE